MQSANQFHWKPNFHWDKLCIHLVCELVHLFSGPRLAQDRLHDDIAQGVTALQGGTPHRGPSMRKLRLGQQIDKPQKQDPAAWGQLQGICQGCQLDSFQR